MIAARGDGTVVAHAAAVQRRRRGATALAWIALAAIPAGLVIAVTAYISTDVAAAPLLWVLPLALYLLTFVAVFRDRPWFSHDLVVKIVPFLVAPLAITLLGGDREYWLAIDRAQSAGAVRAGARLSRRGLRAPPGARAAHRVLSLDLVRRRDRRHLRRPARAASVQPHLRISDPGHRRAARAAGRAAAAGARLPVAHLARARGRCRSPCCSTSPASGYRAALAWRCRSRWSRSSA